MPRQVLVGQRQRGEHVPGYPGPGVAAEQGGADAVRGTAGGVDQRSQRGAVLDLVHARTRHRARQRHEGGAWLGGGAEQAKPVRAVTGDQRQMGERLRVAHQGGAAPHSLLERQRGREGGPGSAPVEVADERRLLTGEVAALHERDPRRPRCIGELAPFGDRLRGGPCAGAGRVAHVLPAEGGCG